MKIAIVGSGISGLVTAYRLTQRGHDVTVYEAGDWIGGHTHTIDVTVDGVTTAVDTGFIVFNTKTYPNFLALLQELGVAWQPSDMSFGFRCEQSGLEYGTSSLSALFAQRGNLVSPGFWRMFRDIVRFNSRGRELLGPEFEGQDDLTLGRYLRERGYSDEFVNDHIVPLGGAVWSSPAATMLDFPARYFVRFFANHGFLQLYGRVPWLVIQGGSARYVERLTASFRDRIRLSTPVATVRRHLDEVEVVTATGDRERYERVVLATHSDTALRLLESPTPREREILSAFAYQPNETFLHLDTSFMPQNRRAWSAWNYLRPAEDSARISATYWMNRLQNLTNPHEFLVTLNPHREVDPGKVLARMTYHHPVYTSAAVAAQRRHAEIDGVERVHFCGAYWGFGFHEDGVKSALAVLGNLARLEAAAPIAAGS